MTTDNPSKTQLMTAGIALVLMISLALVGAICYGLSLDVQRRVWSDIFNRPGGPMTLRFVLQPLTAIIAALHDGIKDARSGRSPYLWTMLTSRTERGGLSGRSCDHRYPACLCSISFAAWTNCTRRTPLARQ